MRVVILLFLLFSNAFAFDLQSFKEGVRVGMEVEREVETRNLLKVLDLWNTVLNYKYLYLKGEVPPPVVVRKFEQIRRDDGTAEVVKKLVILPPAHFPVSVFENLKGLPRSVVVPRGYVVLVETEDLTLYDIAYYTYIAQRKGYRPVLFDKFLVFASFERKPDAKRLKEELEKSGIVDVKVKRFKEDLKLLPGSTSLAQLLQDYSQEILEKEKSIVSLNTNRRGIDKVVQLLELALDELQNLSPSEYRKLNVPLVEEDVEKILNNIYLALSEQEEYKTVFRKKQEVVENPKKLKQALGYGEVIKEIQHLQELVGGEN